MQGFIQEMLWLVKRAEERHGNTPGSFLSQKAGRRSALKTSSAPQGELRWYRVMSVLRIQDAFYMRKGERLWTTKAH